MQDKNHIRIREEVGALLSRGYSVEEVAKRFSLPIGTRFQKGTIKWYRYCMVAKQNQKKAIEKDPKLYSKAGKIAQQKHPYLGEKLGKKYGPIQGKINAERLRGNSEYFSKMAKRLQEINPDHSRINMKKAHETMKVKGTFNEHQRQAALRCKEKNPNQLKEMSHKAHNLYPLALLALESHRKNYPYEFMGCLFDSNEERIICKKLVEKGLIGKPVEKENVHFQIGKCHVDFFIQNKLFLEFHPPIKRGKKRETEEGYYSIRRILLNKNGFECYPLIVINHLKEADEKIKQIEPIIHSL
ncbi:MAG: hypothetical protein KKA64_02625 [Nanoarchaeota archaeon]|nr:hypothetical protein [Nanoarchaeota archaeon]